TELRRSESMSGSTGPLGTPKTQRTPACSRVRTIKSLLVMVGYYLPRRRRKARTNCKQTTNSKLEIRNNFKCSKSEISKRARFGFRYSDFELCSLAFWREISLRIFVED